MMEKIFNRYLLLEKIAILRKWFLDKNKRTEYSKNRSFVYEANFIQYIEHIQTNS